MSTPATYHDRYRSILAAVASVDPEEVRRSIGAAEIDQAAAAARDAQTMLHRVGTVEQVVYPGRFPDGVQTGNDPGRAADLWARVMAAMADPSWSTPPCTHLRRTPAQPIHVQLALRRMCCSRCASTHRRPSADEADRCDLCGSRGHVTFWPVRFAVANWLVLGDMCGDCADGLGLREPAGQDHP